MVLHSLSTTQSQNEARPPCCNCDAGDLLKHAINLIDPPLYSVDDSTIPVRTAKGSELNVGNAISEHSPICNTVENQSHDDLKVTTKKKKVQFNEPSCNERKKISVKDAIRAYEYLSHAIDIESGDFCDETIPALISWSKFQHRADSFRALLVTCNLLLEMLPDDHDTDTNNHVSFDDKCGMICPKLAINQLSSHYLTQATIKQLLSSSRRCILSLKYIERMCAAKAITERHTGSVKTFYTGGDDIEDYDRCTNDLHMDYDWHDDGYLPEPALYSDNTTTNTAGTSLLHECCYRPHTLSVQPSSRYEKSASTKKLVRGERLISMSLDEYGYQERYTSEQTNEKDYLTNDSNCWSASGLDENQDESITKRNIDRTTESPIQDKEDAPFFTLSPSALAKEEQHLLDIMVSCNPTNLMDAASSKPKKKKRKQKQSQMQMLQPDSASYNSHTNNPYFDWKEGYLLFGHNDHALPITRKVYAKVRVSPIVHFSLSWQCFQQRCQYEASSIWMVINRRP